MRIRADSSVWLKTLRDLKGTLVLRLQRAAGPLAPRALAFVEGAVAPRASQKKARGRLGPAAVLVLPDAIRECAERIPTPEGRDVYLRAAAAFQARFGVPKRS